MLLTDRAFADAEALFFAYLRKDTHTITRYLICLVRNLMNSRFCSQLAFLCYFLHAFAPKTRVSFVGYLHNSCRSTEKTMKNL
jgi:hypothetical protein